MWKGWAGRYNLLIYPLALKVQKRMNTVNSTVQKPGCVCNNQKCNFSVFFLLKLRSFQMIRKRIIITIFSFQTLLESNFNLVLVVNLGGWPRSVFI